jgi:hypothetical protein
MAAHPDLDGIPVIVLSSLPERAIRDRTTNVARILQKPYTAQEVLEAIASVLGEMRATGRRSGSRSME